ncbi:MAG: excinuclease ABC subunit UvrC [Candidatus Kapaibacterium sp.]
MNNTEEFSPELMDKLASLTTKPGVYQYKNDKGKIIYVGKAKNLRARVKSYFRGGARDAKTTALLTHISDVEVIVVDNEAEALILEDTLIKKHKPKYNILLRDDKTYPYVRVTSEEYPRVFVTRKVIKDGSKYFGPFTEVKNMRSLMKMIRSIFKLRSCDLKLNDKSISEKKFKICLDYHIDKCDGPCEGFISKDDYNENVKESMQVLAGRTRELEKQLEEKMMKLSEEMKFEQAASIRNKLAMLKEFTGKQKVVSQDFANRDVFGLYVEDDQACAVVFKIREGKLTGKRHYIVSNADMQTEEKIIQRAVEKWYMESDFIPGNIHLPNEPEDTEYLLDFLSKKRGRSINLLIPKIGDKRKFVEMANTNAKFLLKEYRSALDKREQVVPRAVLSLQRDLRLAVPPRRIECFDNSHMQGSDYVSSVVVFVDGKPKKSGYRKFKIKTVEQNDDYAAMREAVRRRYTRLIEESEEEGSTPLPDLIIIDGGKGQLSAAFEILKELDLDNEIQVIGLAKRLEEIFFPGEKESLLIPRTSSALRLVQHLRDEAHRFAITYHRKLRNKRTFKTELTEIEGIGEKTAQKLLVEFGSVENIKKASEEELQTAANKNVAAKIKEYFSRVEDEAES